MKRGRWDPRTSSKKHRRLIRATKATPLFWFSPTPPLPTCWALRRRPGRRCPFHTQGDTTQFAAPRAPVSAQAPTQATRSNGFQIGPNATVGGCRELIRVRHVARFPVKRQSGAKALQLLPTVGCQMFYWLWNSFRSRWDKMQTSLGVFVSDCKKDFLPKEQTVIIIILCTFQSESINLPLVICLPLIDKQLVN